MKRHGIHVLREAGHTVESIAEMAGVSSSTVKRVSQEGEVTSLDDAGERKRRGIGRPSKVAAYRDVVAALCKEKDSTGRPLQAKEIVRRLVAEGYPGRKSAMYGLIASMRPREKAVTVRFEGVAGEFSQHDFGQVDVRYQDGRVERIRFFASRLKYSRYVCVTLVANEQTETVCRCVVEHFEQFGGVPLMAVFDRPSTVVQAWRKDGTATKWNPVFGGVMLELGVGVELCWPARGNQ
jgi:transposase